MIYVNRTVHPSNSAPAAHSPACLWDAKLRGLAANPHYDHIPTDQTWNKRGQARAGAVLGSLSMYRRDA